VSISSTFNEQLLLAQIPEAQKKTDNFTLLYEPLGSALIKAARKMLVKLIRGVAGIKTLSPLYQNTFRVIVQPFILKSLFSLSFWMPFSHSV